MRLESLLLSAILLSCLSYQTYAIELGAIAEPSIKAPNMNMPKPIITSPNMDTPEAKQKPQAIPGSNPNQTLNQTGSMGTNQTQVAKAESNDVSGKWSIKFDDRPDRSLDLTLWSSGRTQIMGYGTLTKGGAGNSVTASGSFAGEELILTVKSAESEYASQRYDEYDLDLFVINNTANSTLSGTYILISGGEFLGDGNATALKR
ncbi:MAG: hypothetical protein M0Q43_01415 [Methanothrix sp.]|nr:hypothetical protein [Methanothrix sp.]